MSEKSLDDIIYEVELFKKKSIDTIKEKVNNDAITVKSNLPESLSSTEFDLKVQEEIGNNIELISNNTDFNTKALYYALKSDVELNKNISKEELTIEAYDFLEKNSKSKFLKKIYKELKKETKK